MFASVSPTIDTSDAIALAGLLMENGSGQGSRDALGVHARNVSLKPHVDPWKQGYSLAQEWSETMNLGGNDNGVDIEQHLKDLSVLVRDLVFADTTIGAVAMAGENRRPVIAVNTANPRNKYPTGRRLLWPTSCVTSL